MSRDLILHPTKGVNAHLAFCPRCKGESNMLFLLGNQESKWECQSCGLVHYGLPDRKHYSGGSVGCPREGCGGWLKRIENIVDGEKLPGDLCEKCKAEVAEINQEADKHAKIVAEGGVYFRCKVCKRSGVIKPNEFTKHVRDHAKIQAPEPVGVEFDESNPCPACTDPETHLGGNSNSSDPDPSVPVSP